MSGLTDADLDLIEKWHEKVFCTPDVTALVAEVRRLRERRERHSVLLQQAAQEVTRLRERVAELEDGIRQHDRRYTLAGGGRACCYPVMGELLPDEDGRDPDDGMTDDEAADAFMAALAEMDGESTP